MTKTNEYLDEAYQELLSLSADERKRLEYEARERAVRDYNSQMKSSREQGLKEGEEIGRKAGEEIGRKAGEEIGTNRVNQLNKLLAEQDRMNDIIRAADDPEFQAALFKEFHL